MWSNIFPYVPFEELYDLREDPFEKNNLAKNLHYKDVKQKLTSNLNEWMIGQDDFLLNNNMPLIKPTLHPLDKVSQWNDIDRSLENKLNESDYLSSHY